MIGGDRVVAGFELSKAATDFDLIVAGLFPEMLEHFRMNQAGQICSVGIEDLMQLTFGVVLLLVMSHCLPCQVV
ncbi:hypothetical protein D3C72_2037070 [compost metagenome]